MALFSAIVFFHRFYATKSLVRNDPFVSPAVAAASRAAGGVPLCALAQQRTAPALQATCALPLARSSCTSCINRQLAAAMPQLHSR